MKNTQLQNKRKRERLSHILGYLSSVLFLILSMLTGTELISPKQTLLLLIIPIIVLYLSYKVNKKAT